ncbi:hypothetical protein SEA_LILBEANIE_95 [Gordonia phage Lilbeanie]|uniref:Uncharacterized protein n=1 Tax=Gordonia phage Lilbeanie TaxID=2794947 RepID=A0A7T1KSD7_9CAUD|nr:hypothetical protein J1773_gp95 [Gordonia phage Lilbeanie]QPO17173.1 hypothetical protein SEA_LILBEANIE_95 [Gordonia phage Lilbeanie]
MMAQKIDVAVTRFAPGEYTISTSIGGAYELSRITIRQWRLREPETENTWDFPTKRAAIDALTSGRVRPGTPEITGEFLRGEDLNRTHIGATIRFGTTLPGRLPVTIEAELRQIYHTGGETILSVCTLDPEGQDGGDLPEFHVDADEMVEVYPR